MTKENRLKEIDAYLEAVEKWLEAEYEFREKIASGEVAADSSDPNGPPPPPPGPGH